MTERGEDLGAPRRAPNPGARWRRAPDVRFRVVGGEGVVVRQTSGEALVVDEVGARILELLDERPTAAEIVGRLEAEYDVEPERLAADVERFLEELLEAGIAGPVEGAAPERRDDEPRARR